MKNLFKKADASLHELKDRSNKVSRDRNTWKGFAFIASLGIIGYLYNTGVIPIEGFAFGIWLNGFITSKLFL